MVYHFVKQVEIDVETETLSHAIEFVNDIDETCEKHIAKLIEDVNGFVVENLDVHSTHTAYTGKTDCSAVKDEPFTVEERLLNHLLGF